MAETTPIHGNYRGYYTKRRSIQDPRLALVPKDLFRDARVLDVGCNEGWITCEIAQSMGAKEVVGVDIDNTLIRAAWRRRKTVWSQHRPSVEYSNGVETNYALKRAAKRRKVEDDPRSEVQSSSFPAAFEHMFGPLPIPPTNPTVVGLFPHNVSFRTTDWVKDGAVEDKEGYDVILAFSITKWIHLNDGDDGLLNFFRRTFDVLNFGGTLLLEPQEWETYAKAKRMDTRLKENAKNLTLRPADFKRVLTEIGFGKPERLGSTGKGGFHRPVDLYRKPPKN